MELPVNLPAAKGSGDEKLLSGAELAEQILLNIRKVMTPCWCGGIASAKLETFKETRPCLAAVTLGNRKDSESYIRSKVREAQKCGIDVVVKRYDGAISEQELLNRIADLNADGTVDGIVIQLPLPSHINAHRICQALDNSKDVDGFHKENLGLLAIPEVPPLFIPCTSLSVLMLLQYYRVPLRGAHCVIIGASANVGIPLFLLLVRYGVTVTVSHIYTKNLAFHTQRADIIVSAAGVSKLVKKEMVKEGCVIIDVGINFIEDQTKPSGFRLVGDVDFDEVVGVAGRISPVPGGIGPVTAAILLNQTADAFLRNRARKRASLDKKVSLTPREYIIGSK